MYEFETYINGFLDLEYPNFDTKHGFLSSVEAEIIRFCQRRQPFAFSAFYVHPLTFEGGSPSKFDKWDLETWLKKRVSFICSVTMFNTILFYACCIRQITCNFSAVLIFFPLKWDHYFIFGFLCLIKSHSDRISTLEPFISQKMGYYTVYVSHLGFLSPASI